VEARSGVPPNSTASHGGRNRKGTNRQASHEEIQANSLSNSKDMKNIGNFLTKFLSMTMSGLASNGQF
jgi:hypothetical protein